MGPRDPSFLRSTCFSILWIEVFIDAMEEESKLHLNLRKETVNGK